jgi:small GTP-binding protein
MNLIEIRPEPNFISNNTIMEDLLLDCHCALFLIDISNKETFESMKKIMDLIDNKKYPDLKKILVQNKSDIEPKSPSDEINEYIFEHLEIDNIKISVKDDKNLEELKLKIYNEINSPIKNITPMDRIQKSNKKYDIKNLRNIDEYMKSISIILLGNTGVGKTNFMMRYMTNEYNERTPPTLGVADLTKIIQIKDENNNYKKYKLKIYDTNGQEKYRCLPRSYFKKVDGALLLLDVNEIETFEDIINVWMAEINQYGPKYEGDGSNFVIYLVGNKIDKLNNDDEEIGESNDENLYKPVTKKEKENLKRKLKFPYYEISNQWNLNVDEVAARIILDCAKRVDNIKEDLDRKIIKPVKKKKKKCF